MALPSFEFDFPKMPDLPNLPGLPKLPNVDEYLSNGLDSLISLGGAALINAIFGDQWGIFTEFGLPLFMADNVLEFEEKHGSRISKLPVEKGSFTSYNKVSDPSEITITFSKGSGGPMERGAFLALLSTLEKSTSKFYVITPEKVYMNYAITGHAQTRTADDGARLMKIAVTLEEVREVKVLVEEEEKDKDPKNKENGRVVEVGQMSEADLNEIAQGKEFIVTDMSKEIEALGDAMNGV